MLRDWNSNNRALSLNLNIKCKGKKRFIVFAKDKGKPHSKYANREITVDGERSIFLSFPITPRQMTLAVVDADNKSSDDFKVSFEEKPLKTYLIWMDSDTKEFLTLCFHFCQVCGFENAPMSGKLYQSADEKFNIKMFPQIVDYMSKRVLSTPARIGHQSGIIEVSKQKFDSYTFAQRMIIMLHEYSHKYRNPKLGLNIDNEIGADINALYIYLGLGFSKVDAIYVFANVFLSAQTPGNQERMRKIIDYINRFENGEFAQVA
jgi:hypothetical protein